MDIICHTNYYSSYNSVLFENNLSNIVHKIDSQDLIENHLSQVGMFSPLNILYNKCLCVLASFYSLWCIQVVDLVLNVNGSYVVKDLKINVNFFISFSVYLSTRIDDVNVIKDVIIVVYKRNRWRVETIYMDSNFITWIDTILTNNTTLINILIDLRINW